MILSRNIEAKKRKSFTTHTEVREVGRTLCVCDFLVNYIYVKIKNIYMFLYIYVHY